MKRILNLKHILAVIMMAVAPSMVTALGAGHPSAEHIHTYTHNVGQFDAIKVQDDVNVIYRCTPDTTGVVTYKGTEDFDNAFILTNNNGLLKIQVITEDLGKPDLPTLYIYSDFLSKIINYSDFDITAESIAPCARLDITQMGNGEINVQGIKATEVKAKITAGCGNISLSGSCGEARFQMVGTGVIQADALKADHVFCRILGGGPIGCCPLQTLKTRGIGSTSIYYRGEPAIDHKGGGKLIPIK